MSKSTNNYPMWCLGLSDNALQQLQVVAGIEHAFVALDHANLPDVQKLEQEKPLLLWVSLDAWRHIITLPAHETTFFEQVSRVLVLDPDCSLNDLHEALRGGFQDVLIDEHDHGYIDCILRRAREVCSMYEDMERMTKELLLQRELMARKSEVLAFLQDGINAITKASTTPERFLALRHSLTTHLPVHSVHTIVWTPQTDDTISMELYLDAEPEKTTNPEQFSPQVKDWTQLLFSTAASLAFLPEASFKLAINYSGNTVKPLPRNRHNNQPDTQRTLLLPLCFGGELRGVVAMLLVREFNPGRDMALAMDALVNYMAASLNSQSPFVQSTMNTLSMPFDSSVSTLVRQ